MSCERCTQLEEQVDRLTEALLPYVRVAARIPPHCDDDAPLPPPPLGIYEGEIPPELPISVWRRAHAAICHLGSWSATAGFVATAE
jgi:hypothetical protein